MYSQALDKQALKPKLIDTLLAVLSVVIAMIALTVMNLNQIEHITRFMKIKFCINELNFDEAERINKALEVVCQNISLIRRAACLEKALAFTIFSISFKKKVELHIGVTVQPFTSHAWVEIQEQPFGEGVDIRKIYSSILII